MIARLIEVALVVGYVRNPVPDSRDVSGAVLLAGRGRLSAVSWTPALVIANEFMWGWAPHPGLRHVLHNLGITRWPQSPLPPPSRISWWYCFLKLSATTAVILGNEMGAESLSGRSGWYAVNFFIFVVYRHPAAAAVVVESAGRSSGFTASRRRWPGRTSVFWCSPSYAGQDVQFCERGGRAQKRRGHAMCLFRTPAACGSSAFPFWR